jgi:S-adenosylmethionine:tRNA ribosyltransferase-isomerase
MYSLSNYDYDLPPELVAQKPAAQRDLSRLLLMNRANGEISHHRFNELCNFLTPSDILIINNTKVIPGRLCGRKETGGKVEVLILDYAGRKENPDGFISQCLIKASKHPISGTFLFFDRGLKAEVMDFYQGIHTVKFSYRGKFEDVLCQIGNIPLPPYIQRDSEDKSFEDKKFYQTVYASHEGAVAAPTAGFHFTEKLLNKIKSKGVQIVSITLHVSYGTFLPVRVSDIRQHRIHSERFSISKIAAETVNRGKAEGKRIIAVGTTCVRTLEFAADDNGRVNHGSGSCDLFIYPGYRFKVIDAMITNFHLPKSTLIMLVSAFAGREKVLAAYEEAIKKGYRFYSYGDAMLIF